MEIVRMDATHVPQIALLETECFSDPWSEKSIVSELANPLSVWLVAVEHDLVLGYVGSQSVLDGADMMNIAVSSENRGHGIATKLINALIEELRAKSVAFLMLEVRQSNEPAISLYQKLGFEIVGRRPRYYHNPREDAWIMRKEWDR